MARISVLGAGSWGIALAVMLNKNGHEVKVWSHRQSQVDQMNDTHTSDKIKGVKLPESMEFTADIESAAKSADVILFSVPSKATRETAEKVKDFVNSNQIFITVTKGIEEDTLYTQTEILEDVLGADKKICVLSGPSHAEEVSIGVPTALVIGADNEEVRNMIADTFKSDIMRMYTSKDMKGVELGGALKNIIAFCAGITAGLKLGDNTFAALLTRGLVEISRLGVALGGNKDTFYGLTGLGDLIVTCNSMHSRNRRAGMLIGQGKTIDETRKEIGMTIESIDNIEVAYKLAKMYNIEVPIINSVYDVLFNNLDPKEALTMLMTRDLKEE